MSTPDAESRVHMMLFLLNAATTWFLVGLIWFVQIVHYPLFARVGAESFVRYAEAHGRRTTIVVVAPMMIELGTTLLLWRTSAPLMSTAEARLGVGLVAVVWISTFALQVPRHEALRSGFAPEAHRWLVASNWVRTVAWSARGALVGTVLARALRT